MTHDPADGIPAHVQRRQVVTLEVELIVYGEGDPEANEIIINGKGYDVHKLREKMKPDGVPTFHAVEALAIWAATAGDWEEVMP